MSLERGHLGRWSGSLIRDLMPSKDANLLFAPAAKMAALQNAEQSMETISSRIQLVSMPSSG